VPPGPVAAPLVDSVTLPPAQKVVGPLAFTAAAGGMSTLTVAWAVFAQPGAFVTVTV
jgi:hypothetical protein